MPNFLEELFKKNSYVTASFKTLFFVFRRDKAIKELEEIKEGQESQIKQFQRKIQELMARIEELEEELENERKLRQKTAQAQKDLESQVE